MTVMPRKQYTDEFNAQIIKLAEHGRSVSELAREFDLNTSMIYTWRRKASQHPQLVASLIEKWEAWADMTGVPYKK